MSSHPYGTVAQRDNRRTSLSSSYSSQHPDGSNGPMSPQITYAQGGPQITNSNTGSGPQNNNNNTGDQHNYQNYYAGDKPTSNHGKEQHRESQWK
ncbi:hypothetical protein PM082_023757 [Marasmius tenuissimus]|nr:hypothetical protein PM082_023757 [Marasmius tenuissimus]